MPMIRRHVRTILLSIAGLALLILVVAWLSGVFEAKVDPGRTSSRRTVPEAPVVAVEVTTAPDVTRAVGTVRAVHETAVGSRLLAPVRAVHVAAGQRVEAGQLLAELDKADIEARRSQAQANLEAAQARQSKAANDLTQVQNLRAGGAATEQELYAAQRAAEVAEADVNSAAQRLVEAETQLAYATIRAPIDGIVIEKLVEEGDLARPGEPLVTLYDPDRLQLVAAVPERLALDLSVGDEVGVEIEAIGLACHGQVSEIVPQASPASRSLLVKVTGPCPPGVVSGMFGRMLIPEGERRQLLVPAAAVRRIGQLEMVQVVQDDPADAGEGEMIVQQRFVRTGQRLGEKVEILAGLEPGERVRAEFSAG